MNILIAVEELRFGGAQTFALRLSQALHEVGHNVWIYSMYGNLTENELVHRLAPDVPVIAYEATFPKLDKLVQQTEGWLERRGHQIALRRRAVSNHLRNVLATKQIEVLSSNLFKCDELMTEILATDFPRIPLVITMHGDYEQFWEFYKVSNGNHVIPNYPTRLAKTLSRVTAIAYLADQNLQVLSPAIVAPAVTSHLICRRIYNGMEGRYSSEMATYSRAALGIEDTAFVIGMVARGVAEKGWQPLLMAYEKLRSDPAIANRALHVLLIGGSSFLDKLRQQYSQDTNVHFLGYVANPIDCMVAIDVGVLPSSLKESLPNSITEYLFAGRPAISTDIGEVGNMLRPELDVDSPTEDCTEKAGILIDFPPAKQEADVAQLYHALRRYMIEPGLLKRHQELAQLAFRKFRMDRCVTAYEKLYEASRATIAENSTGSLKEKARTHL